MTPASRTAPRPPEGGGPGSPPGTVGAACQDGDVAQTFGTPLIGRDEEVARLSRVLERARAGEARAVLVAGDAGVGKTRMLTEIAGRAARSGVTVLTGHCVDLGDVGLPYLPFTEVLGAVAADERLAPVLAAHPEAERMLGGAPDAVRDVGGRLRLFEGMAALLADLSDAAPVLLVLEDLHWADQSSRDLLRFLLSRGVLQPATGGTAGHRLAVLASYRADDLHRRHPLRPLLAELVRLPAVERLELRPLADAEVARLVRSVEDRPLPDATVRRIVERAEGNAFYAEELVAATGSEGGGVPSGLADVLLIRVEQLSDTAQQVLRTAAVAGRRVEHDLLRDAVGLPDDALESALREAVGHQLLVAGERDTYSFRHALAREAVYGDLLPGERARLHGAFARLLAGRGPAADTAAERAHHYRESHDPAAALAASLEAAGHAQRVGAPAEELRHLEAALDLWEAVPAAERPAGDGVDRVTLMLRASAAAAHAGESHRAVSLTRAALAGVGQDADSELAARVRYTLAGNLIGVDSLRAAYAYSSEALEMIPAEPPSPTWVWAAATHVLAARQVGDDDTALRVGRRALAVAERLRVTDAQADLLVSLANLEGDGRRSPEGRARLTEARELARRAGNAPVELRALYNLAVGAYESGELEESLPWLAEGLDRARRAGLSSSPYPMEMRYLHLVVLYTLGRWDACVEAAEADAAVLPASGGYTVAPALHVALARGELDRAADRARAARRAVRLDGHAGRGHRADRRGRPARGRRGGGGPGAHDGGRPDRRLGHRPGRGGAAGRARPRRGRRRRGGGAPHRRRGRGEPVGGHGAGAGRPGPRAGAARRDGPAAGPGGHGLAGPRRGGGGPCGDRSRPGGVGEGRHRVRLRRRLRAGALPAAVRGGAAGGRAARGGGRGGPRRAGDGRTAGSGAPAGAGGRAGPPGTAGRGRGRARAGVGAHGPGGRRAAAAGARAQQPADRRGAVHQRQDGQRPRLQHPGEAGRGQPHRGGRDRLPGGADHTRGGRGGLSGGAGGGAGADHG